MGYDNNNNNDDVSQLLNLDSGNNNIIEYRIIYIYNIISNIVVLGEDPRALRGCNEKQRKMQFKRRRN